MTVHKVVGCGVFGAVGEEEEELCEEDLSHTEEFVDIMSWSTMLKSRDSAKGCKSLS